MLPIVFDFTDFSLNVLDLYLRGKAFERGISDRVRFSIQRAEGNLFRNIEAIKLWVQSELDLDLLISVLVVHEKRTFEKSHVVWDLVYEVFLLLLSQLAFDTRIVIDLWLFPSLNQPLNLTIFILDLIILDIFHR